jgi:uncharacterized protein with NAD-binding domain and iron-sulfur cluster
MRRRTRTTKGLPLLLSLCMACACFTLYPLTTPGVQAFGISSTTLRVPLSIRGGVPAADDPRSSMDGLRSTMADDNDNDEADDSSKKKARHSAVGTKQKRKIAIIGAGWGGLSAAHALSKAHQLGDAELEITVIEANSRVGGVVRDGFTTMSGNRPAEAGQHGFWNNYANVFRLFANDIQHGFSVDQALTDYAAQGQYSPSGLEAIWPVYQNQELQLPTGLAQAAYTKFLNLPLADKLTAFPLVAAFADFDDSAQAWKRYDAVSFRDLCIRLGVSRRCYEEAFEPMILTGLFAPGAECSAAAALGMAYFFVLQSQSAFDVQWCRGNIGTVIFDPWVATMKDAGVNFACSTRVTGFDIQHNVGDSSKVVGHGQITSPVISSLQCTRDDGSTFDMPVDNVIFAVGAKALNSFVRFCPELAALSEFRRFANLRGTSVLATRLFLDRNLTIPYSANACWGFDKGIGMTAFDIKALHGASSPTVAGCPGSVIEVDYYHASTLLVMSDEEIVAKVKSDLDNILGTKCKGASVSDAAVVRLPEGVNWYFPGSYADMPDLKSTSLANVYFAGDIVRTRHGSWSQEKAFVTGVQAANLLMGRPVDQGVLPVPADEVHVKFGKQVFAMMKTMIGGGDVSKGPSLVDFLW